MATLVGDYHFYERYISEDKRLAQVARASDYEKKPLE